MKMISRIKIFQIAIWMTLLTGSISRFSFSNVYLIIYATKDGKTGHAALAIDNYNVEVYDLKEGDRIYYKYDTVRTNTLTYFDLWPKKEHFRFFQIGKNIEPVYHKLPQATYNEKITVTSITKKGIPKVKAIPCDGLICFKTTASQDFELSGFLDSMLIQSKPFNVRKFNCSDFVVLGLEKVLNRKIRAREFIPMGYSTTPNKLFRQVRKIAGTEVIRDPGEKIKGSFFKERVLKMLFTNKKIENPK